jgi:hypothetical protein
VGRPNSPAKTNPEVLSTPTPPPPFLAVFKSLTSVQLVPFQDSVTPVKSAGNAPPAANADDCVPNPIT